MIPPEKMDRYLNELAENPGQEEAVFAKILSEPPLNLAQRQYERYRRQLREKELPQPETEFPPYHPTGY